MRTVTWKWFFRFILTNRTTVDTHHRCSEQLVCRSITCFSLHNLYWHQYVLLCRLKDNHGCLSTLPHQLLQFCREVADGMKYLSNKGFVHRDLAARNVLLDKDLKCHVRYCHFSGQLLVSLRMEVCQCVHLHTQASSFNTFHRLATLDCLVTRLVVSRTFLQARYPSDGQHQR